MKILVKAAMIVVMATLAMSACAQESSSKRSKSHPLVASNANPAAPAPAPAATESSYLIGAQDVLDISVWKEAELSRVVPVRPDGKISLPLLNDVQAAGLTPMELAAEITSRLRKAQFLADPQVTVIVREMNSQRIYILGEIGRPGAYPLMPGMTVLQALSGAGGFSAFADQKGVYVLRIVDGQQKKLFFNYKEVLKGVRPEQNILLKAGDTIVVP